jgi:hypothetical protein
LRKTALRFWNYQWIETMTCSAPLVVVLLMATVQLNAQESRITNLVVEKKAGRVDGKAMATVLGPVRKKGVSAQQEKTGSIANHAVQAWPVMSGRGALLLLSPAKQGQPYRLRYYQLDEGKGRLLGFVPLSNDVVVESPDTGTWAFAISGTDPSTNQPVIFAGDVNAIHARLENASDPQFSGESFSFRVGSEAKSLPVEKLLGWQAARNIYLLPSTSAQAEYLQISPNGSSTTTVNTTVQHGHWISDGMNVHITSPAGAKTVWPLDKLQTAMGMPAESRLTVRLLEPLSSRTARQGIPVRAVLLSPGIYKSKILIPQGSEFDGSVIEAHGVGWGVKHESAALTVHFDSIRFPDGRTLAVDARILKVENSREEVTTAGKIQGIRSTGTLGHTAENQINSLAQIDPIAYLFTSASGPAVLGFAEPEILYSAGTELDIAFNRPLITDKAYDPRVPSMKLPEERANELSVVVQSLPFRTETETSHVPSDITNLIFIGTPDALRRSFEAAGWTSADSLTAAATFQTVKTLSGNQTYTQAPMSVLTLNGKKPLFTLQKTTNTFSSRHHLRVFPTGQTFDGQPVLTASSTQDIGIAFSYKQKTFIHVIDQYLDNERSKVINDLEFTECVTGVNMVPRPWVPQDAYNSTGDRLRTDGNVAVLRLDDCIKPYSTPTTPATRASLFERSERNTMLTIKDTLYRGNLIYTGISGGIKIHHYLSTQGELGDDVGNWRKSDASGTEYRMTGAAGQQSSDRLSLNGRLSPESQRELDAAAQALIATHKWDAPHYEIALNLGYSNYRNNILESTALILQSSDSAKPLYGLGLADGVFDGWAAGVSLTINSWSWISNELSYMRQQTKFDLVGITISSDAAQEASIDAQTVGLVTRRFAYNTIFNLRPRTSRWRPYVSAGPAFQLLALSDAPLKKPAGVFKLGLANIGLLKAAFDFGSTPPLDGGGIFQFGLQYGGGIKYRVTPRFMVRGDYGETWSPNPRIIRDSYLGYIPDGVDDTYTMSVTNTHPPGRFIQQRATVGFAFTF